MKLLNEAYFSKRDSLKSKRIKIKYNIKCYLSKHGIVQKYLLFNVNLPFFRSSA